MPYTIPEFNHAPHVIPDATPSSVGMMTASDKSKLNSFSSSGAPAALTGVPTVTMSSSTLFGTGATASLVNAGDAGGRIRITTGINCDSLLNTTPFLAATINFGLGFNGAVPRYIVLTPTNDNALLVLRIYFVDFFWNPALVTKSGFGISAVGNTNATLPDQTMFEFGWLVVL